MKIFLLLFLQSIRLSFRKGGGAMGACAFYVIVVTLFTFALGADVSGQYASAIFCVSMLLAIITTLPLIFERDYEDGTLEQLLLQPVLLELLVFAKICGQWCSHIVPILFVSPFLSLMANLSFTEAIDSLFVLFIASVAMVSLGAIGAALTLGSKRGGLLQALVVMPLYIPVLIFASGVGGVFFLAGIACASIPLACLASASLIRISEE